MGAAWGIAVALAAGMLAQVAAVRLGVPGIVVLLVTGVALGPDVTGVLDPATIGARGDLIALGVAVILFEGGLGLDAARLRRLQRPLLLLLTAGAAISMATGAFAVRLVLGLPWAVAVLYGAIMIVTGPTVVTPLLSRLTIDREVRELLVGEGVLIDPLGAIVAIVTLEAVSGGNGLLASATLVVVRLGVGAAIGVAAGGGLAFVLRRRWIPEELQNPLVLGVVLLAATLASRLSAEAGLMAAVVQGVVMANAGLREIRRLREFKEALTVLVLSLLFVILAAGLRLANVALLGWRGLAVVALLVWIGRPLAVLLATAGSGLAPRQRLFVAWICPRGIVAAGVAGLFHVLLDQAGIPGGAELEALVFVTVACTVTLQGLTARRMARALGVDTPSLFGTIVVGADRLGRLLERLLVSLGRQVAVVDRDPGLCRRARAAGLSVYEGDALSLDTLEEAGARYADTVICVTRNPELNALVVQRMRASFPIEYAFALAGELEDGIDAVGAVFPGDFPGVDEANRALRAGRFDVARWIVPPGDVVGRRLGDLPYAPGEFALLVKRGDGVLVATADWDLAAGDEIWCGRVSAGESPLAAVLDAAAPPALAPAAARP